MSLPGIYNPNKLLTIRSRSPCPIDISNELLDNKRFSRISRKSGFVSFKAKTYKKNTRISTGLNTGVNKCTYLHKLANLSADILQYLFHNNKLSVETADNGNIYLKINDSSIPIINQTTFPNNNMPNLKEYVTLKFDNVFDLAGITDITKENYDEAIRQFRMEPINTLNTKLYSKDENGNVIIGYKTPCKTFLGKNRNAQIERYLTLLNPPYNDATGITDNLNVFFYMWDNMVEASRVFLEDTTLVNPGKINSENYLLQQQSSSTNTSTNRSIKTNKFVLRNNVIMEKLSDGNSDINNEGFIILGYPSIHESANMLFHDKDVMGDKYQDYKTVLDDQTTNYKEYLKSFLKKDGQIISLLKDSNFDGDTEYFEEILKPIFPSEDKEKIVNNVSNIINQYTANGECFNLPNITFEYSWNVLKYSKKTGVDSGFEIEPAFFHIREVNAKHKVIFERILELCRTVMLDKYGLKRTKSLFIYTSFINGMMIKCIYMHPLNILFRNVYFYNRVITIEDLIHTADMVCDGSQPEMVKYKGMPFWSVVPIEIITSSITDLDSFININILMQRQSKLQMNSELLRRNTTHTKKNNNSRNQTGNQSQNVNRGEIVNRVALLLGNKNIKFIIANRNQFDTYVYITCLDTSEQLPEKRVCYNMILEINLNDEYSFADLRRKYKKIKAINNNYQSTTVYGLIGVLCKLVYLSEPISPLNIPKKFNFKGYCQVYRQYSGMDTILKKERLTMQQSNANADANTNVKQSDSVTIINPFKFHSFMIVKFIYNILNILNRLNTQEEYNQSEYFSYAITDEDNEKNILRNNDFLNNELAIYHYLIKTSNFLCILIEFTKDKPKSKLLYSVYESKGLKNFKYTLWIIPLNNAIDIITKLNTKLKDNTLNAVNVDNVANDVLLTDNDNLQTKLFNITCVDTPEKISDVVKITDTIKDFISSKENINQYELSMNVNEIGNFQESNLHFHFERKYTYYKPLVSISTLNNVVRGNTSVSLYKYPTAISGHFPIVMTLNKMQTNAQYCYNTSLYNRFSGLLKYSGILTLMPYSNL